MFQPSEIQTLVDLGLTSVQARVYLSLAKLGALKTSEISKHSEVARPDVYRTLVKLQELSLVERVIAMPVRFRAVPINEAVDSLLKMKTQNYEKLKEDSKALLEEFSTAERETKDASALNDIFVLVPRREAELKRQVEAIDESKRSIDVVLSWSRYYHGQEIFDVHVRKALSEGVHVRCIVEEPPFREQRNQALREHEGFELRFTDKKPKSTFAIFDQELLMILVDSMCDSPGASPSLWTNNSSLMALVQEDFDLMWKRSKSEKTDKGNEEKSKKDFVLA